MPAGKPYLYFLVDDMNRSFFVENGLVVISSTPTPLEDTPDGWQDIEIENVLNQKYFGLDRNYTNPLSFVGDGAQILKDQYYKKGVEVKTYLIILKQKTFFDGPNYGFFHDSFFKGEIDYSNFDHTGPKVTVNIMEGGIAKIIKAKENTTYEISMNHADRQYIRMDGVKLKESVHFAVLDGLELKKSTFSNSFTLPVINMGSDSSIAPGIEASGQDIQQVATFAYYTTSVNYMMKALSNSANALQVRLKGKLVYRCVKNDPNLGHRIKFFRSGQNAGNQNLYQITSGTLVPGTTYTVDFDVTIPLQPGEQLFLQLEYVGGATGAVETTIVFDPESKFDAYYDFLFQTTFIRALPPLTVLKELINKMSDGQFTIESDFLTANDNIKLTCGDSIRGITEGVTLKSSFSDFFQSFDANFDLAVGFINGVLRLETKEYFMDSANPVQLGTVKNLSVTPVKELLISRILIGYNDITYNNVNGKQEFNAKVEWGTPITRQNKDYDGISPYRADSYGIEFIRINLEGKTTTDNSGDTDVFMIHTNKNSQAVLGAQFGDEVNKPIWYINRDLNATLTGVLEPASVFNLYLSPKRMFLRKGRYFRSMGYKMDGLKFTFQTHSKNKEVKTSTPEVIEKKDIVIGTLPTPYFTANELNFESPAPINLLELFEGKPIRSFEFSYEGATLKGVAVKTGIRDYDKRPQEYTLYSDPSNNLEQLIKISN